MATSVSDLISRDLLEGLKNNPKATVGQLTGCIWWLSDIVGWPEKIRLDRDVPFLSQAVRMIKQINSDDEDEFTMGAATWDPMDGEGYDGPKDLCDYWHTDCHSTTGQYSGTVVRCATVTDEIGAIVIALAADSGEKEIGTEPFYRWFLGYANSKWVPPIGQDARDANATVLIHEQVARMCPEARRLLVKNLVVAYL